MSFRNIMPYPLPDFPGYWRASKEGVANLPNTTVVKAFPAGQPDGTSLFIVTLLVSAVEDLNLQLISDPDGVPADLGPVLYFAGRGGMALPMSLELNLRVPAGKSFGIETVCAGAHSVWAMGYYK